MGRRYRLLTLGVTFLLALGSNGQAPASASTGPQKCSREDRNAGICPNGALTPGGASVSATSSGRDTDEESDKSEWVPPEGWFFCYNRWRPPEDKTWAICPDAFTVNGPPVPTLSDVREFFPDSTAVTSEPNGWAVKGKPTNFIVPTHTTIASGTVLELPTEVRFTPTAVRWDYGDGATASTTTGGATWAALDQPRFTRTATSHTYDTRAEHTVTANVEYTVSYRFAGGDWKPIDGTLSIPTPPTPMRIVVGSTVLVQGPCTTRNTHTC